MGVATLLAKLAPIVLAVAILAIADGAVRTYPVQAGPNEIRLEPEVSVVGTGDSTEVAVVAEAPSTGLHEWRLTVKYDPSLLTPVTCRPFGDPSVGIETCNTNFGPDTVGIIGTPRQDLFGVQTLARIRFAAIGASGTQSELRIAVTTFKDSVGNETNPGIANGAVHIQGTGKHGIITGLVYEDENQDGMHESSEPGLFFRDVSLMDGVSHAATDDSGSYIFADLEGGNYELTVSLNVEFPGECTESSAVFHPLRLRDCIPGWVANWEPTTPETVSVSVTPGQVSSVNFGARHVSSPAVMSGIALLNGDYAPVGTPIVADFEGRDCGGGNVSRQGGPGNFTFVLGLLKDSDISGCPRDGERWHFTVGGVPAVETVQCCANGFYDNLIAMPEHAWYWAEQSVESDLISGLPVVAMIDGVVCGTAAISTGFTPGGTVAGFNRLAVPSENINSGCGRPGAPVTFIVGGQTTTATWEPGLHMLELPLDRIQPTPTPSPKPTSSVAPTQTPEPSAVPTSTPSARTPSAAPTPAALPASGGTQGVSVLHYSVTILVVAVLASVASVAVWRRLR